MTPKKWVIAASLFVICTLVAVPAIGQRPAQNVLVANGAGQPVPTAPRAQPTSPAR